MTARQLPLDLPSRTALDRDAFFVSESNATALAMVEDWQSWPGRKLALSGPPGSGKTHLAHVWAELSGARIVSIDALTDATVPKLARHHAVAVEGLDAVAELPDPQPVEAALFHLHNLLAADGGHLLLTGRGAPSSWIFATADLTSRVLAAGHAPMGSPDDALIQAVIVKIAADRQLALAPNVPNFLAHRLERSLDTVARAVEALDRAALAAHRRVNTGFAREVLGL
ncbi:HdaA/DnaA family protein [Roseobacter sp. HKCCA0434]|uniref:HdaA/DnaA family protein n=1 Tax=Roseobacter sp. HKCCA0434 TaxID=3079297 RepID=UPI0029059B7A|nr:DnaA/Hda family protein [Roseobacter sp. HKCCA0434]